VGAEAVKRGKLGFMTPELDETQIKDGEYSKQLKRLFRPEFLNRIDEMIVFDPLSKDNVREIVVLLMAEIQKRLDEMGITVELTEAARTYLADTGYDPEYGARPLRRLLQKRVENELSRRLLRGNYQTGDQVIVDYRENEDGDMELFFDRQEPEPIAVEWSKTEASEAQSAEDKKNER
jgi:ATP-dependent Clp protease ATP-binding subunit ClpC